MGEFTTQQRSYPPGVPCWVDTEQPDPEAATSFYGGLFGWTFQEVMPPGAPGSYLIAQLDDRDVAAIGSGTEAASWNTYIAVADADASASAVTSTGGAVLFGPEDAGPGGRTATCLDPAGAEFRLWQARRRLGAQIANLPGAWNFSVLHTTDLKQALSFYSTVFGWTADLPEDGTGAMVRLPGYGDHLAATIDPGIHERQAAAPPGFADVVAGVQAAGSGEATHWQVVFTVRRRDESAATAERLGATVLSTSETVWTKTALVRDPQGAELVLSEFTPPG
ncbi:MAG TPA: VOC family protein [Kineosporiaceae bacterium]|nr:VOC family protein [Kineosporiaceae bacterium]